ncbi:hypothetical protein GCM10025865_08500 [Paraoerskovia sediminicola]|uniref:DUF3618 domain-containing protein n=1 Tax=Paraoerskovia sediminicola TaxID=1138587 RepID=A0ABN6XDB1_9CELL|nr:DUF3618 domain-containing protein [Paraoerskovia sediminicola]BDZ41551.1 hypothetical protein GCM10025865_08500 [Paraoerskovia sediminicola]
MSNDSQADLESEISRTRAELAATIDELTTRLHPKTQAKNAADAAKQAADDAKDFVTGQGLPGVDNRDRNAKVLLATAAAGVALVVAIVVRATRS